MLILRYVLYFAFAFGALAFWALFVLGVVPFGEPACSLEPQGCSLTFWERLLNIVTAYGAMPVTALTFVFYRRWCAAVSVVTKRSIRHSQLDSARFRENGFPTPPEPEKIRRVLSHRPRC